MIRIASLTLLLGCVGLQAGPNAPLLAQQPAMNSTHIVFVFADDLWSVPRQGGEAKRLTTGTGSESNPHFSPDGKWIAFTGQYDGNTDVFLIASDGGVPRRLTWHPAPDVALGWTPDGKRVVFQSGRNSYSRFSELYTISVEGGLEEKLPLPMGYEASYSPDARRLAYVPLARAFGVWKRYRGGRATPVWIADLANSRVEKVPHNGSNDFCPMWVGDKVYFLSDREGKVTLFAYDTKSKKVAKTVANPGMDFKSASSGPDGIVIEEFGGLHVFDLKTSKLAPVNITVSGDINDVRPRLVNVGKRLSNAHISPTGARAVFEARGEILTVPADKGDARNLTGTAGVMERDPSWSPDGKWIAYFSDEAGEYELHYRDSMGRQPAQKIRLEERPTFYRAPRWSPDSKKIAYQDVHMQAWYVDIEQRKPVKVDRDRFQFANFFMAWSPDSRWIAYTKRLPNYLSAVYLYSVGDAKASQVTDGMSDAAHPVFDKDGKYLYFTASTDIGPSLEPDIQSISKYPTRSIYLAVLSKADTSPLAPESDEEKAPEKKAEGPPAEASKTEGPKPEAVKPGAAKPEAPKAVEVRIDFDGISQRILALPMPARRYAGLQAGKGGTLFAIEAGQAAPGSPPEGTIHRFDLKQRKADVLFTGVRFFEISANGEKTLTARGDRWMIEPVRPMPPAGAPPAPPPPAPSTAMKTESLEVKSEPRAEWEQMYRDAWRIQREFFYDPNLHGVNFADFSRKYEKYLREIQSRRDLNYLFAEMMGEITVGHLGVVGGDQPEAKNVPGGLLGCDYSVDNGRYRFARIYGGENWNPDLKAPLTQPGVNVNQGEYLLAVNGRDLPASANVYEFFEATSGKNTLIKVGPNADGSGAREVTVSPVPREARLRNLAWIEDNRRKVDQATGGRVAYVYMPDTAFGGLTNFTRYFYAQVGKEAVIIDERFNGGGLLATDIIEILSRKRMSAVATRDGADEVQPQGAIFGPKVMLINEFAGSGGDAMPNYFRRAGVGKLIGKRTWGGLVGRAGAPQLMDGGIVTAPSSGVWGPDSKWDAENIGVPPDLEVELDPELVRQGKDPQLEKAIEVVLAELSRNPVLTPKRPSYPNYQASPFASPSPGR
ncbi:MAG: PD40 domain-containing protein [Bryobacterales bacterium]|nr:PD40 domain-containing protein [Bryobacterales bacterium]